MGLFDILKKPEQPVQQTQTPMATVLIADDEKELLDFYQDLFTRQGYQAITATNGQEALTLIRQQHPNVILLDVMMPVVDGIEVLKQLSEDEFLKKIPVIVLTNVGNMDTLDQLKIYSVYKFYIKANVAPEDLIQSVRDAVTQFQATAPTPTSA